MQSPRAMYAYEIHVQEGTEEPCDNSVLAKHGLSPLIGQLLPKEWALNSQFQVQCICIYNNTQFSTSFSLTVF